MSDFNKSLYAEIREHIALGVHDLVGVEISDLHHELFNTSYYIIGYYKADQWLQQHYISAWDCIDFVQTYESVNFGKAYTPINSERMVNMLVYIVAEDEIGQCLNDLEIDADDILTNEHVEMIQDYYDNKQ